MSHLKLMLMGCFTIGSLAAGPVSAAPQPVVLELFTSNGCSSCPPAYVLLNRLSADTLSRKVNLIRLDEHVDYWNQLGWVDRYSSHQYTHRQQVYAREVFGKRRVYTPQLVVNGKREVVGGDATHVRGAIEASAAQTTLPVSLQMTRHGSRHLAVNITLGGSALNTRSRIWLAVTQDHVVAHVGGGENGGRTLHEDGVVRTLRPVARLSANENTHRHYKANLTLPRQAARDNLHVVVFVQQSKNRAIIGAATHRVTDHQLADR